MLKSPQRACCAQPEALVVILAVPLCQPESLDGGLLEDLARGVRSMAREDAGETLRMGLPLRCAAAMPCEDAIALAEGVGHVVF